MLNKNYEEFFPIDAISSFVFKFWRFDNTSGKEEQISILPDGNFELIVQIENGKVSSISMFGLTTKVLNMISPEKTLVLGISFRPLASEYILQQNLNDILNGYKVLDNNFWGLNSIPTSSFEFWVEQISKIIDNEVKSIKNLDDRKQEIFKLLFQTNGTLTIQTLSQKIFWTSRQLNRYFKSRFGLSLKSYCNLLRSHAIFKQILDGDLSPIDHFYDQSHLIREIKKHTGHNPSELNKNDRFIQFNL